jgi:hypothetical protein
MNINPEVAVTTTDNPYNQLTDYDKWDNYDRLQGYNTSEYLARVVRTTTEFGEGTYIEDINRAVDEIVLLNLISMTHQGISYKKVVGEPEAVSA